MLKTGLILCSGEGNRMKILSEELKLPKQLFPLPDGPLPDGPLPDGPLPDGPTIAGRIAAEMSRVCDRIICTISNEEYLPLYQKAFTEISPEVEIIVKKGAGEYVELEQVLQIVKEGNLIQTNGDLIFESGAISDFITDYGELPYFLRGREGNPANKSSVFDIFNSRISVVPIKDLKKFCKNNKISGFFLLLKSLLTGHVRKVPTLFNVDTPEDYQQACAFFNK